MRYPAVISLALLGSALCAASSFAQLVPSQALALARSQIVMLTSDGAFCAGIIVSYDDKRVYIATAAHLANLSQKPLPQVKVKFEDLQAPRDGQFWPQFETREVGDLAVVTVEREAAINQVVSRLDFAILSPVTEIPTGSPVKSIGYNDGGEWSSGKNEKLLPSADGYLRFESDVTGGQSGGGLYNEAFELMGMPLDVGANGVYARPIASVLEDLRGWKIPVLLATRAAKDRARGLDEIARGALSEARLRRLRAISSLSRRAFDSGNCVLGLRYAMSGFSESNAASDNNDAAELGKLIIKGTTTCPLISRVRGRYNTAIISPDGSMGYFDGIEGGDERWNLVWKLNPPHFVASLESFQNRTGPTVGFNDPSKIGFIEEDNVLRVYSTETGKVINSLQGVWAEGVDEHSANVSATVSADGRLIALSAEGQKIRILHMDGGVGVKALGTVGLYPYDFSPDGKRLIIGTDYPQHLEIWEVETGKRLFWADATTYQGAAKFSPDGKRVAIWGLQGAEFWSPDVENAPTQFAQMGGKDIDQKERIASIVFSTDGKLVLVVGEYHSYVWDFVQRKRLATVKEYLLSNANFLPAKTVFFGSGYGSFLKIWRVSDGALLTTIPTQGQVKNVGMSKDGKFVTTGTESSVAEMWDLEWLDFPRDAQKLYRLACRVGFLSSNPFTEKELDDPILRGEPVLSPPCASRL